MSVKRTKRYNQYIQAVLDDDVDKAVLITANAVQAQAKALAPVDTGNLRGSIVVQNRVKRATVYATANYAKHVEFGTKYMRAIPFMRPAALLVRSKIVKMWRAILG